MPNMARNTLFKDKYTIVVLLIVGVVIWIMALSRIIDIVWILPMCGITKEIGGFRAPQTCQHIQA